MCVYVCVYVCVCVCVCVLRTLKYIGNASSKRKKTMGDVIILYPQPLQGCQPKGLARSLHIAPSPISAPPPLSLNGTGDSESPVDTATSTATCEPKHGPSLVPGVEVRTKPSAEMHRSNGIVKRTSMVVEGASSKGFIPMIRHGSHEVTSTVPSEIESSGQKFLPPIV